MKQQFENVPAKHGAPMGRRCFDDTTGPIDAELFRMRLVDGAYDDGGAYWGAPANLFCARGEGFLQIIRADSLRAARDQFEANFPEVTFLEPGPDDNVTDEQINVVAEHYLIACIWADAPEGTSPRPTKEAVRAARIQCRQFILSAEKLGRLFSRAMARYDDGYGTHPDAGSAEAAFGHDFYLTRQGHGVGFQDRKELSNDLARKLADLAHEFGETYPDFQRGWLYP